MKELTTYSCKYCTDRSTVRELCVVDILKSWCSVADDVKEGTLLMFFKVALK